MKKFVTMILAVAAVATLFIVSASAEDVHYISDQDTVKSESGLVTLKTSYGVLNAGVDAGGEAALGSLDQFLNGGDNDGNGLSGKSEAKANVAEMSMEVLVGSEENNFKSGADVTAVGAEASVGAGFTVKDGKLNVGMEGGAEAKLVEVKGKVGGTVGGVEMGVEGGVKVGIGGKVQAGFVDGKLTVGLDASLGVGFEAKVDIDVGAAAEKVVEGVKAAHEQVSTANYLESTCCFCGVEDDIIPDFVFD